MDTKYIQDVKILSTQVDHNVELGLIPTLSMLQDNMCEYYRNLGCDGLSMVPVCGCFFVLTKTKIKILSKPKWLDNITIKTYPSKYTNIRMDLSNEITFCGGTCAVGKQEMCLMDSSSRRLRKIDTSLMPKDLNVYDTVDLEFEKLDFNTIEMELVDSIKIKPSNLDFYKHTNNLEYVKFIENTFSLDEWVSMNFDTFEIHYLHETRENDVLDIYKKKIDNDYLFQILCDDRLIVNAKIRSV